MAQYPFNRETGEINLPDNIVKELKKLLAKDDLGKIEALRRTVSMTGAGLKVSKDYLDSLI